MTKDPLNPNCPECGSKPLPMADGLYCLVCETRILGNDAPLVDAPDDTPPIPEQPIPPGKPLTADPWRLDGQTVVPPSLPPAPMRGSYRSVVVTVSANTEKLQDALKRLSNDAEVGAMIAEHFKKAIERIDWLPEDGE